jgi:uncharacterized protein
MQSTLSRLYIQLVFKRPWLAIAMVLALVLVFGWFAQYFRLDVSADSLLLEGDKDLEYSREINQRYGVRDSVIVAFTPPAELFSRESLSLMAELRDDLLALERVESVDSILNVPIFADTPLMGISEDYLTVSDPDVDLEAARQELMDSPVFSNAVVSPDGQTAALLVSFAIDQRYIELINRRTERRNQQQDSGLNEAERAELEQVSAEFEAHSDAAADLRHQDINEIRTILDSYQDRAELYLGGAPMIADDLVTFVQSDLAKFSLGVFAFIVLVLGLIFRSLRWVVVPLVCCAVTGIIVVGILGLMDWRVTVVSSNFMSLLLIITISLNMYLIVRYRELRATRHFSKHDKLLRHTVLVMFKPCLYTALTTIVAFGSLVVSGITPIISFGWIMVMGVITALLVVFTLFPAILTLLPKEELSGRSELKLNLTGALARGTDKLGNTVLFFYAAILLVSIVGLSRLQVENSFIGYFSKDTEIYQGMTLFDQKLGGTLSFDVVIDLPEEEADGFVDDFDDGFGNASGGEGNEAYWFTGAKMDDIKAIHEYLQTFPHTGKVVSFGAVIQLAEQLNNDQPVDSFVWALLYSMIPEALKSTVLTPYVSVAENQLRFNVRVIESDPELSRDQLIRDVKQGLIDDFGLEPEQVNITGILVMYNNVLQSLYQSQILTLGVVLGAIMLMFLILFNSLKVAVLCIIPNIIAAFFVLGLMGWLTIPLDIMTITIAAISIGIGVDNTIQYMYRFKREFHRIGNYRETMYYCHSSIARAMYFTSMTIVAGFSILVLSNFIPTIVFGLLTSIAMLIALFGALTLLPQLLIAFKPLGPEHEFVRSEPG